MKGGGGGEERGRKERGGKGKRGEKVERRGGEGRGGEGRGEDGSEEGEIQTMAGTSRRNKQLTRVLGPKRPIYDLSASQKTSVLVIRFPLIQAKQLRVYLYKINSR